MSKGMIKVFLFYQRLAREEKLLLLLLAGSQALAERHRSSERRSAPLPAAAAPRTPGPARGLSPLPGPLPAPHARSAPAPARRGQLAADPPCSACDVPWA